jgi:hypothetical protein
MIALGNPTEAVDPAVLEAPGGFAWWYMDVITPGGDGLVLIWSYGLPFLPGYADAARRGRPVRPIGRPSVNLALYRAGRERMYLLQEYPEAPYMGSDVQVIGGCRFRRRTEGGRCLLEATLDCPVPGSKQRLTGSVRLEGAGRVPGSVHAESDTSHVWTPLAAPATATVMLSLGGRLLADLQGRAYHDRNMGFRPLHELGIQRWMWGRFPFADAERVYYLLWPPNGGTPRCLGLTLYPDGSSREAAGLAVEIAGEQRSLFGLRRPRGIRLVEDGQPWMDIQHTASVDVGPFYLRFQSEATLPGGERSLGWGELCEPDRVDLRLHRPLVRMRVHRPAGHNSFWLPLFNGPRGDRAARLLRHALARSG